MSSVHAQALPDNLSGMQRNPSLNDSVSPAALERANGNETLAITMQVTSTEAMNILAMRGEWNSNAAGWFQKAQEKAANDNEIQKEEAA